MGIVLKSFVLSFVLGMSCKVFFDTLIQKRKFRYAWAEHTELPAFTIGFMLIALTEIPPYIFQPIRFIAVLFIVVYIYYQVSKAVNLILSTLFCGLFWLVDMLILSVLQVMITDYQVLSNWGEIMSDIVLLCLMMLFYLRYKGKTDVLIGTSWKRFAYFPIFSLITSIAATIGPWSGGKDSGSWFLAIGGFALTNMIAFYFIWDILLKEAKLQKMRLAGERIQNQMKMYRNMQQNYEQQRRYMHDYKNQLNCIQGMLAGGEIKEAEAYIAGLTGSLQKRADYVNTNHTVVNVVLNQKYQYAQEKDITMSMIVNDLSALMMSDEELVTILVNLLDNAIEACEKLVSNKVIQFKMVLEEGQLIISIKNTTEATVKAKPGILATTKKDKTNHGIGLSNVDAVIRKNKGTAVLRCEEGWFYYSAMIPQAEK